MREIVRFNKDIHPYLIARIKLLSQLKIDEHFKPQDGRFRYENGSEVIDIRVSIVPTLYGEKAVLRLLASSARPLSFKELGIFDHTSNLI